jgi:hypothetical protein
VAADIPLLDFDQFPNAMGGVDGHIAYLEGQTG